MFYIQTELQYLICFLFGLIFTYRVYHQDFGQMKSMFCSLLLFGMSVCGLS